jgi:Rap1a immunity proteins
MSRCAWDTQSIIVSSVAMTCDRTLREPGNQTIVGSTRRRSERIGSIRLLIELRKREIPMRHLLWISLFVTTLNVPVTFAQDTRSAQAMLPRCMESLKPGAQDAAGERCMGILATLTFVSRVLPDNLKFCQPTGTTPDQMMQVIDSFMTANKEAVAQDFRLIALAAMHEKWPCQE